MITDRYYVDGPLKGKWIYNTPHKFMSPSKANEAFDAYKFAADTLSVLHGGNTGYGYVPHNVRMESRMVPFTTPHPEPTHWRKDDSIQELEV